MEAKIHKGLADDEKLEIAHKSNSLRNDISKKKLKERAVELRKQGRSYRQIGRWLGVHHTTVLNWCKNIIPTCAVSQVGKTESTVRYWLKSIPAEQSCAAGKTEGDDGKQYPTEPAAPNEITERRAEVKQLRDEGVKEYGNNLL